MPVNMQMKILIVDDSPTMLKVIENTVHQMGFRNLDKAADGPTAFAKIQENKYDLILSDWNMEPMSGLELLKKVRTESNSKTVPFILITAESKVENIIAAKQAGVNNYIVKPFTVVTLKEKLVSVIGNF